MCVFCASIPVVMALGAEAKAKQNQDHSKAEVRGKPNQCLVIPAEKATIIAVTGLVISSVIYHTHFGR
jgi:hypothetical protein